MAALPVISLIGTIAGAGMSVYAARQQSKDAQAAAEFNAEQARRAAKIKSLDDRENALRRQEVNRKHLGARRAHLLEKGNGIIEGGDADFLDEEVGNLELSIMDDSVRAQRAQAGYANQAFQYDFQAKQAKKAGRINTAAAAIKGFNSITSKMQNMGFGGGPDVSGAPKAEVVSEY
tara:strand:- start:334 stop:861 length:528 start_codon:yes stop_codon:yes gene_type:complete